MQTLTILNTREIKKIREQLVEQFGGFFQKDYAYLKNEKNKVFIINKDLAKLDLKTLRIDRYGLYVMEVMKNKIRLSKEGTQLLAKECPKLKNVCELTDKETRNYFQGIDLDKDLKTENKLILLEHKGNFLGCASYKDKTILNFLPKINRGEVIL